MKGYSVFWTVCLYSAFLVSCEKMHAVMGEHGLNGVVDGVLIDSAV